MDELLRKNWPESYGFSIYGPGPTYVISVEKDSIAHQTGLCPGDQLIEFDGYNVSAMSEGMIKTLARSGTSDSPSLGVVSKLQFVELKASRRWGYGLTLSGIKPTLVATVDPPGPAYLSGIKPNDMILEIDGRKIRSVQFASTLLNERYGKIVIAMVAMGAKESKGQTDMAEGSRILKARTIFMKMAEAFADDFKKKVILVKLMKQYAEDRNVESFSKSLMLLLVDCKNRSLISDIRTLVPLRHREHFDQLVTSDLTKADDVISQNMFVQNLKTVTLERKNGSFGLLLKGNAPVAIESIMKGSSAEKAGLRSGDRLLKINNLNVRNARHDYVIKLLQSSGDSIILHVDTTTSVQPISEQKSDGSSISSSSRESSPSFSSNNQQIHQTNSFSKDVDNFLTREEKLQLRKNLLQLKKQNDFYGFVASTNRLLNTQSKNLLWQHLLPRFDREQQLYIKQFLRDHSTTTIDEDNTKERPHEEMNTYNSSDSDSFVTLSDEDSDHIKVPNESKDNFLVFKQHLQFLLTPKEKKFLHRALQIYHKNRKVNNLIEDVSCLFNTPSKKYLWRFIIPLLPPRHQKYCREMIESILHVSGPSESDLYGLSTFDSGDITFSTREDYLPREKHQPRTKMVRESSVQTTPAHSAYDPSSTNPHKMFSSHMKHSSFSHMSKYNAAESASQKAKSSSDVPSDATASYYAVKQQSSKEVPDDILKMKEQNESKTFNSFEAKVNHKNGHQKLEKDFENHEKAVQKEFHEAQANIKDDDYKIPTPPPFLLGIPPSNGSSKTKTPQISLKRINWEKLDKVDESSIWAKIREESEDLDDVVKYLELEQHFSNKVSSVSEAFNNSSKHLAGILNARKAYNISILLRHAKISPADVQQALIEFDEAKINSEILKQLVTFAPDSDEMQKYEEFNGSVSDLNEADKFTIQVCKIPAYKTRLQAMIFKATFLERLADIQKKFKVIKNAASELLKSSKLSNILEVMLAIGNFMNRGNARIGEAPGFKINFLSQIDSTKSSDGKKNFLHALAEAVQSKYPRACQIAQDLPSIHEAAKISDASIKDEVDDMKQTLAEISTTSKNVASKRQNAGPSDKFFEIYENFFAKASNEVEKLGISRNESQNDFKELSQYFGGLPKDMSITDLYLIFSDFVLKFEKAIQFNASHKKRLHGK